MAKKATTGSKTYGTSASANMAKNPKSGLNAKSSMKGLYRAAGTGKTFMQRLKGGAE